MWMLLRQFTIVICLFLVLISTVLNAQDCRLPILSSFATPTSTSLGLNWFDFNTGSITWDIEYGLKGFSRTGIPDVAKLDVTFYTITGLETGTTYEIYLRANCNGGESSLWNGPYFANTVIVNSGLCDLGLEIPDDNCPQEIAFLVSVSDHQGQILGRDLIIEYVDLIIEHPWPPDLRISLVAPDGREILLSAHNGTAFDNYGNYVFEDCSMPIRFSDNACQNISESKPPFIGEFQPEQALSELFGDIPVNGLWELRICDRASGDLGSLQYIKLGFSDLACIVPPSFGVSDLEADKVTFSWQGLANCEALELSYKKETDPIQASSSEYVVCDENQFTLKDLEANTAYELIVRSECNQGVFSPPSCLIRFVTACSNSTQKEEFDDLKICKNNCDSLCDINSVWRNANSNLTNWLLNDKTTLTSFTGPEADRKGFGNYLYIESQANLCDTAEPVILISDCLTKADDDACALSFSYHMYGIDIGRLEIAYSIDSINWTNIWQSEGDQGEAWSLAQVSIPKAFQRGLIRFLAQRTGEGVRADIAIDNIKLIGIDTIAPMLVYTDNDGDGFGARDKPIFLCSESLISGYAINNEDCDDTDPNINPQAVEINCNQLDENCNGDQDDLGANDIGYILGNIFNETCLGAENGFVSILGINGQQPYTYSWSNGAVGQGVTDLGAGIYYCTISDLGGCQVVSEPIIVDFEEIVVYSVKDLNNSTCLGGREGIIELRIEGGVPPYQVFWNNGRRGSFINGLADGVYYATISDASSCITEIDSIVISSPQRLTTGVAQKLTNDCNGDMAGSIILGILGGLAPYEVIWDSGHSGAIINGLKSGYYTATVTDQNDCESVVPEIFISEPDELMIDIVALENITCYGESDAFLDITVSGGNPPYSYFWSDGSNHQDLINKSAGIYSLTVTDVKSCSAIKDSLELTEPGEIEIGVVRLQNVNCAGSKEGYLEVDASGGTGPYEYNWGIFDGSQANQNFLDTLESGSYSLTVVDNFECKSKAISIEIDNLNIPLNVSTQSLAEVSCFGDSTGVIYAVVSNGKAPYDYNWSSGNKTVTDNKADTIHRLIAGRYNLTVTDAEGCIAITDSIQLRQSEELEIDLVEVSDNLCWTDSLGSISLSVIGGLAPYMAHWSSGAVGLELNKLPVGLYIVSITDNAGCSLNNFEFLIDAPDPIQLEIQIEQPTDSELGSIEVFPKGGSGNFQYNWAAPLQGIQQARVEDLEVGLYPLNVIDGNGCSVDTLIELKRMTATTIILNSKVLKVYPNPTTQGIWVKMDNQLDIEIINLFDVQGQAIQVPQIKKASNHYYLDLSHLPRGLYFLSTRIAQKVHLTKFLLMAH